MTRKEMNQLRAFADKCSEGLKKAINLELDCRSMANSCLIYKQSYGFYDEEKMTLGHYAQLFLEYGLSEEQIIEIYYGQKKDYLEGEYGGIVTDFEGCTYYNFSYADER